MKIIMLTFHDVTAIFYSANNRSAERRQDRKKIVSTFCCSFAGYETFPNCSQEQAVNAEEKRVKLPSLFSSANPIMVWRILFWSSHEIIIISLWVCRVIAAEVDAIVDNLWDVQIAQPKGFEAFVGCEKCKMMYFGLFAHANTHYAAYVSFKHVFVLLMGV